jgi:hypothetical protein
MTPVVLFAYRRVAKLERVLSCLRANHIPKLIAYSDGPADARCEAEVTEVRKVLGTIDWCDVDLRCRVRNCGLGRCIRSGVSEVLRVYDRAIVFEDDIECCPGTYAYLDAALAAYAEDTRVMSVSGFTHPRLTPPIPEGPPFFSGRYSCWGWGTWRRAWRGMSIPAPMLLLLCRMVGRDVWRYGADVVDMAWQERRRNIWAVRFFFLHLLRGGLSLHPVRSLTNHMGFDDSTTSAGGVDDWSVNLPSEGVVLPDVWPRPVEHESSPELHRRAYGKREEWRVRARRQYWLAVSGANRFFGGSRRSR